MQIATRQRKEHPSFSKTYLSLDPSTMTKNLPWRLATLATLFSIVAHSHHVKLSWVPFTDSPENHGYTKLCDAVVFKNDYAKPLVDYTCDGVRVAVWNADGLPDQTLEFATPCGSGGYALRFAFCLHVLWSVCIGDSDATSTDVHCFGLGKKDDGEWRSGV